MIEKAEIMFLGTEYDLKVTYDCYQGEEITVEQSETVNLFMNYKKTIADRAIPDLRKYCQEYMNNIGEIYDDTKLAQYVIPKELFVRRSDEGYSFAVMCDFSADPEHGIALVYDGLKFTECGPQDLIL